MSLRKRSFPQVGSFRRMIARPMVVFPLPLSPTRPTVWPLFTTNDTSSTAFTSPTLATKNATQDWEVNFQVVNAEAME